MSVGQRKKPIARSPMKRGRKRSASERGRIYGTAERLDWLHSLPCCVTGVRGDIEAAHVVTGGTGRKADAKWLVPMARELHRQLHQHGVRTFQKRWGVNLKALAIETERAWLAGEPPSYLHTTDPLCATCGASFREDGEQCASCAYQPCDSDC